MNNELDQFLTGPGAEAMKKAGWPEHVVLVRNVGLPGSPLIGLQMRRVIYYSRAESICLASLCEHLRAYLAERDIEVLADHGRGHGYYWRRWVSPASCVMDASRETYESYPEALIAATNAAKER